MINSQLAKIFRELAMYHEMEGAPFKPQAYEKVAQSIEELGEDVKDIYEKGGKDALRKIPGVGEAIADKIEQFIKTGKVKLYEEYKKKIPIQLDEITRVEGVGAKMTYKLYKELRIRNLVQLEQAAHAGKIRELAGFGIKSEEKILKGIEFIKQGGSRFILGFIEPFIEDIKSRLEKLKEVEKIVIAGSYRRRKETIGDADFLVIAKHSRKSASAKATADEIRISDYFVSMPEVVQIIAHGDTKSSIGLRLDGSGQAHRGIMDMDLRVVPAESFGAALNYFTGSKEHNVALREIAIRKGLTLNEYGLFKGDKDKKGKLVAGKTEEELYKALGMQYVEPEMRENTGEIELSQKGKLPKLIDYGDLKGDLQTQTNWTDGSNSIEEMASAAQKRGLEYIVITDHTKYLAMTGGMGEDKLLKQMRYIDNLNSKSKILNPDFRVLKGAEVNIMKDGTLDIEDRVLAKLDFVGVGVHSHFNLSKAEQTKRVIRAMQNPNVDCIFHLSARIINKRPAIELDFDAILQAAKKNNVIMEIDAFPDRLDIKDDIVKRAVGMGIKLSIDSDAHHVSRFDNLKFGIGQARRGWAKKSDVVNTFSLEKFLDFIESRG